MPKPRKPFGGFRKTAKPRLAANPFEPAKSEEQPAPRQPLTEDLLCCAIRDRKVVILYYNDDTAPRSFEPTAVYHSTRDKVCVSGVERGADKPKNLEVGKIRNVAITELTFAPDQRFDRYDKKYANGILCSV